MACAKWLLPVPGGPRNKASSRRAIKLAVARSNTRLRFIFLLKLKSKLSSVFCWSRKPACLRRRSSSRSPRRVNSSETRLESRSMGVMASTWACCRRISSTAAMPPRRNWRKACANSIRFIWFLLLRSLMDQIAVLHQFPDQRIDLVQAEWELRLPLEVAPHKVVLVHAHFQSRRAGLISHCRTELLSQGKHAQDATHADLPLAGMDRLAEGADVCTSVTGAGQ